MNLELLFNQYANLRVAIIGETILDEFISVHYQGQSMKSFCPVFQLSGGNSNVQLGGASAIARHLEDFVESVEVFSNNPDDIVKTRYIDVNSGQKHLEFNKFNQSNFPSFTIDTNNYDVVIVADFGHGLCDNLEINDGFHLMCQTNSHNFGFNRLSKWKHKKKKSICIDLREASLQINKRIIKLDNKLLEDLYNYELNTEDLFVTLGREGAAYTNGGLVNWLGAYETRVVDTIGAGDAFFSFAALNAHLGNLIDNKLFLPSLAASLTTTWLCNDKAVTKNLLEQHYENYKIEINEKIRN